MFLFEPEITMYVISAMYKFVTLEDYEALRAPLYETMCKHDIRGTLILAKEGINGTVAGTKEDILALHDWLANQPGLDNISHKESFHHEIPFNRVKVKLKKEIVTMGVDGIDPLDAVGTYVKPKDWNAVISADDVVVIDTRNDYEIEIGSFEHAINPKTKSFREFPEYVKKNLNPNQHKKVAMFCTGGIRCEKSTALMKGLGFDEVYHLEGGILKYLEEVPESESLWKGECFVFDERVAVNHALEKGHYEQCHACRMPITAIDMQSDDYVQGVSCPHCINQHNQKQISRFKSREKQCQLAKQRGESHIGAEMKKIIEKRKASKRIKKENNNKQ